MADIQKLRDEVDALDVEIRALHETEDGELREFTPEDQETYDGLLEKRATKMALVARHQAIADAAQLPERTKEHSAPDAPNVIVKRDAMEVIEDRYSTSSDLADAATRSLEGKVDDKYMGHVRKVLRTHAGDRQWATGIVARSTDTYASAWLKMIQGREYALTSEERTVLGVTTNANGAFLLPTHLDPTLIFTDDAPGDAIRGLARVETLTDGQSSWNGITSAGVSASWDGETVEVSDDSPTFGKPSIDTHRAQALVQASISAVEDISGLDGSVMQMFQRARAKLEGAAHATGSGSGQPFGVFTAVAAVTASRVTSTTAATIGLVDLNAVYVGLDEERRATSTWVANPTYTVAIKALGTAVGASYSGDLTAGLTTAILDRPVVSSDWAPSTQTTTALDNEVLLGDFSEYVIVDRPGGMSVEYIPHLFNTTTNLPDGRRAWYATWRTGADVTNVDAFRLLVDKTTA